MWSNVVGRANRVRLNFKPESQSKSDTHLANEFGERNTFNDSYLDCAARRKITANNVRKRWFSVFGIINRLKQLSSFSGLKNQKAFRLRAYESGKWIKLTRNDGLATSRADPRVFIDTGIFDITFLGNTGPSHSDKWSGLGAARCSRINHFTTCKLGHFSRQERFVLEWFKMINLAFQVQALNFKG